MACNCGNSRENNRDPMPLFMYKFCETQNILLFLEEIVRKPAFPGKAIIINYFYGADAPVPPDSQKRSFYVL
jgi:hypothetical protein